jgi:hypothetical protein
MQVARAQICLTKAHMRMRYAGSAIVKYGSLLIETPFHPNLQLGLAIISLPCLAYSIFLLIRSQ